MSGAESSAGDREQVRDAFRALGRRLAGCRKAARLTQEALAAKVHFSRSTVANVEAGRSEVCRAFWENVDQELCAQGSLVDAFDEIQAVSRRLLALDGLRRTTAARAAVSSGVVELAETEFRRVDTVSERAADGGGVSVLPSMTIGGVTLCVTPTVSGGVRIVIEAGPVDPPAVDTGPVAGGAQILPFAPALHGRAERRASRRHRPA
ncbi:helix-turn-helix transcriptional regulator [Actinoplanes sp. CA-054009]